MRKWLFWSHCVAFVPGGSVPLAALIAIGNVEQQRRYQELKSAHEELQRRYQEVKAARDKAKAAQEAAFEKAEAEWKEAKARLTASFQSLIKSHPDTPEAEKAAEFLKGLNEKR